jgi:hypothetical protein
VLGGDVQRRRQPPPKGSRSPEHDRSARSGREPPRQIELGPRKVSLGGRITMANHDSAFVLRDLHDPGLMEPEVEWFPKNLQSNTKKDNLHSEFPKALLVNSPFRQLIFLAQVTRICPFVPSYHYGR